MSLNRDDALGIAKKLGATIVEKKAHAYAQIWHKGKLITQFGIRRGRKDLGHDHIKQALFVNQRFAWDLAKCPKSHQDWIDAAIEKGQIEE